MSTFFTVERAVALRRLKMLQQLIAEQSLEDEACPLLMYQLTEAEVLANKFLAEIRKLKESHNEH